ncbi:hypothetical protein [Chitinophaga arvensicola]|uniref:Histone H1/5 n=1 Tax=Chitinophaga arvensicola TaxID=29529 RepID=A0A1I0RMW1_9BACT|nr:hypothetical protein [Chitinophaga arvensicola]SEW42329.1 hypothetical protein SAMN04488122_3092 [Chitinophaga arvensicola]
MTDSNKPTGKHLKKNAGLKVTEVLTALTDLKELLGEKKFHRNVKKAAKAMIAGLTDRPKGPAKPKKKAAAEKAAAPKATSPKATAPKAADKKAADKKVTSKKTAPKKAAAKKD